MNKVILTFRILFIVVTIALIAAALYIGLNLHEVNGGQALTVVLAAAAAIGAIASWNPIKEK